LAQGEWEGVPDGWSIDRKGAWAKSGKFRARNVQAKRVRSGAKRASGSVEVE